MVAWDDSDDFCDNLVGVTKATGAVIALSFPHRYPGNPRLMCRTVRAVGIGSAKPDPKLIAFDGDDSCRVSAYYDVPQWDVLGDQVEQAWAGQAIPWGRMTNRGYVEEQVVKIDGLQFQTQTAYTPEGSFAVRIPVTEYHLERANITSLNQYEAILRGLVGCLDNSGVFGFSRGLLLFDSWDSNREPATNGDVVQTFNAVFKARPFDWNAANVPGTTLWDIVQLPDGSTFYQYADLSPILYWGLL